MQKKSCFAAFFVFCIAMPLQAAIVYGPWLGGVTDNSIKVVWITDNSSTDNTVHFGTDAGSLNLSVTSSDNQNNPDLGYRHVCALTGLQAGTTYFYKTDTAGTQSLVHSFRTAVNFGDPFQFLVVGDVLDSGAEDIWGNVMSQAVKAHHNPAFFLMSGDITASDSNWQWTNFFFKYSMDENSKYNFNCDLPWYTIAGNHETDKTNFIRYAGITNPKNYSGNPDGLTYSFTYGNVVIAGVDFGEDNGGPYVSYADSANFVNQVFSDHNEYFKVAFNHYPVYPCGAKAPLPELRDNFVTVFENNGAHIFFHGHDHNYQHTVRNNVHYITSGACNPNMYDQQRTDPDDPQGLAELLKFDSTHHSYIIVDVTAELMSLRCIDSADETVLDAFHINMDQTWATGTGTTGLDGTGTGTTTGDAPAKGKRITCIAGNTAAIPLVTGFLIIILRRKAFSRG